METIEIQSKGWEKRGVYNDPKLSEISKMYEEIGYIIRIEPFQPGIEAGCNECMKENADKYRVLYTKKKILNK